MFRFFKRAPALEPVHPVPSPARAGSPPATPAASAVGNGAGRPATAEALAPTGWLERLRSGLRRTGAGLAQVFSGTTRVDESLYEDLEAALLMADTGLPATTYLLGELRRRARQAGVSESAALKPLLVQVLAECLEPLQRPLVIGTQAPTVIMVVGVNGAGKTTSIGKLTHHLAQDGCKVLLAAADTFRAAAREQLAEWGTRNRVDIVSQQGGDPSAVGFDAVQAGRARGCDVVIADTAGRLPTQAHLMEELRKVHRTLGKAQPGAPHEVLLVVDGNTGQNALAQVQAFDAVVPLTGLVVTKLDGTAKGGVLAAIARWQAQSGRALAVYFIGVGEGLQDLQPFDAREFAQALLG